VCLSVFDDPTVLSAVSVAQGADWPGGVFTCTINSPPGVVLRGVRVRVFIINSYTSPETIMTN
jgi:hypothetical protein